MGSLASRLHDSLLLVIAAVLTAGTLVGIAWVAPANADEVKIEKPTNKNDSKGSASDTAIAVAKARESKKRVEVVGDRTTNDTVWANPDGTVTHEKSSVPIRAKGADGKLADIDKTLERRGERLAPKVAAGDVSLSADGKGRLGEYTVDEGQTIGLTFAGDLGAPETKGAAADYQVAGAEGVSVRAGALADGLYSHVILDAAPKTAPEYTFDLALDGLEAKLEDGVLSLYDGKKIVAQSRPLTMWDSQVDAAGDPNHTAKVDAKLVQGERGTAKLVLTPSAEFLNDPKTKYPVTIDPDLMDVDGRGDTYYFNGQSAGDSRGSDYRLITGDAGGTHRSLVTFSYEDYVGETIIEANLKLHQYSSATCTAKTSNFFPTITDTAATIVWATRPTIDDSARFKASKSYNNGQGSCPDDDVDIDVTSIVSAWASGVINSDLAGKNRQGIELRASSENDSSHDKRYCSDNDASSGNCSDPDLAPTLSVTYAAEMGSQDWYSMTDHSLNAASTLSVNNRSGNAYVEANDGAVASRGPAFAVTRAYNSQSTTTGTMGPGWNLGFGPDVWIEKRGTHRYDYHAPNGTHFGTFFRETADSGDEDNYDDFISPLGGVGAELNMDFDNGGSSDHDDNPALPNQFKLTFNDSQTVYHFNEVTATGHFYLAKIVDRSGNTMTFTYADPNPSSGAVPVLSSITDSGSRVYNVTYSSGRITKIKEASGLAREWNYTYNGSGYLTKFKNPDGKDTDYSYNTSMTPNRLNKIEQPANQSGLKPTTEISYDYNMSLHIDQVTAVSYLHGTSLQYVYSWQYHDDEDETPVCEDHGDFSTEVEDPNAKTWTYCFKPRDEAGGERKTWVYDGEEREQTGEFNVDKQTETVTTGLTGSTVATYAASKPDQIQTVTAPKSGSTSGERTNIDYDHDPGAGSDDPKGGDYLPSSVTDPNGDCTRYEYDSTGRLTAAIIELRGSGSDRSCSDDTSGGVKYKYTYNSDGTIASMADGNAPSSATDAQKTIYTYWATGDAGYVAGTVGLLKTVRKPGGDCSTTTGTRKLCTSYTYDTSGRVKTVTDGKNQVTTMAYDVLDRTTAVYFNGATACDVGETNCVKYEYDDEGNLKKREENSQDTTFTYDRMNRQTKIVQPGSIEFESTFDGVGNLTGYVQKIGAASDTVTYGYDGGNFVTSITDSAGTITTEVDDDGYIEEYVFPGTNGVAIEYDILDNGKPEDATVTATQGSGSKLFEIAYDYTDGSDDEDQLQSRDVKIATGQSALIGKTDYEYEYGRLAEASDASSAGPSYTYEHDNIGNVTLETKSSAATHWGYNRAGQLCWKASVTGTKLADACPTTPSGGTSYSHDAAGNNTTLGSASYNTRNQVTNLDGQAMAYLDLANSQRTSVGSTTIADGPLGITGQKIGTTVTWYTRMPDGLLLDSREVGGATQVYFTEPNSKSVAALFSSAGALTATYLYSPYGETTIHSQTGSAGNKNPFRYISGWQDGGPNGFYKLGHRYYDGRGHFTQSDPVSGDIFEPRTLSAYHYAMGDPINLSDPNGLLPKWVSSAWNKTKKFVTDHRQTLATIGTSIAVGVAVGSICATGFGCAVLVGAAAGLGGYAGGTAATGSRWSWSEATLWTLGGAATVGAHRYLRINPRHSQGPRS